MIKEGAIGFPYTLLWRFWTVELYNTNTEFPTKHDSSKTTWMSFLNFELFCNIYRSQPTFTCMILETINTKSSYFWTFQNVVCLFCAVNFSGDIKSFVQILNLLNETKIVEIWTKFFISPVILKSIKKANILELSRLLIFCDYTL